MKGRSPVQAGRTNADAAVRQALQRIEHSLVKFGARLPIRGSDQGVQHGLSIALALIRDELAAIEMAMASATAEPADPPRLTLPTPQSKKGMRAPPVRLDLQAMPDDSFIRQTRLLGDVIPVSSATLWRWVKAGAFPAPVKLGTGMTAWRVGDVRAWLQARQKSGNR